MKICSKCKVPQALSAFSKHHACKDGVQSICKQCQSVNNREYRTTHKKERAAYDVAHKNKRKTQYTSYNAAHKERMTAKHHYQWAHNSTLRPFKTYKNMAFCSEWDTAKNTPSATIAFAHAAEAWMKQNCPCPGKEWELHVDKTPEKPFGYFGPGGIRWMKKTDVHQKMELAAALRIVEAAGYTIHAN